MRRGAAFATTVVLLVGSRRAAAGDEPPPCGGAGHPGIVVRAQGLEPQLRARTTSQLRAALAARSFDLCEPDNAAGAIAELDISSGGAAGVALSLAVRDEVTDKRVSRELDLAAIPEDSRALVIAQAADELLRASWAELLVSDAPKPKREVPPEVTRTFPAPETAPPPPAITPRPPIVELGAAVAMEYFGSGLTQLGPDVSVGVFPFARVGAIARAGLRSAARVDVESGSVDPSSFDVALAVVGAALPRTGRIGLDAGTELFVTRVRFEADALAGGRARSESGTAVHVSAVARGWAVVAAPLRATLGLALGAPLHTVRAVAVNSTVTSVSGLMLGAHFGLGGAW